MRSFRVSSKAVGSLFVFGLGLAIGGCSQGGDHGAGDGYATASDDAELTKVCGAHTNGPVQGVDVSYYQGNFNWAGAGVQFGAARISDGTGFIDPDFASNWSKMKAAGVIRSAYQFFEPGENEVSQANLVISKVGKLGAGDLPVMLDIEVTGGQSPGTIRARAQHWLDLVEAGTGKRPFVYSYGSFLETNLGSGFGKYPLWIANYGPTCPSVPSGWTNWVVWQYSDGGGHLDHDVYNGSLAQLKALAGDLPPRGYLDAASCTTISGWAQDQVAPTASINVTVTVDATLGHTGTGSFGLSADVVRADLMKPLGSENHGFSIGTPLSLLDTQAHKVYAYAVPKTAGMPTTLLSDAPKTMTCAMATPPIAADKAVKRHVVSPTSMKSWKLTSFWDVAPETVATVASYEAGDDFPAAPEAIKSDDGSAAVYVVDGMTKRHVVNPASLAAWQLTPKTTPAATVDAMADGPDWPAKPFLVQATGDAAVYAIDYAPAVPAGSGEGASGDPSSTVGLASGDVPADGSGDPSAAAPTDDTQSSNGDTGSGSSSGCSASAHGSKDAAKDLPSLALFGLAIGAVAVRRRKRA